MRSGKPRLGITMGDPAGVGPEIIVMALEDEAMHHACQPLVIGDAATMAAAVEIVGSQQRVQAVRSPDEAQYQPGVISVLDLQNVDLDRLVRGQVDP
ncbi:MAG: 4-hydroxythreonine-4-phosphate dehydrogenase PdxA, partial [Anaerolineae bacterium]|nr:4-hydroxythreonine-4-phosphate dehydrogenase PdxA [Anaerolineae bacterium]